MPAGSSGTVLSFNCPWCRAKTGQTSRVELVSPQSISLGERMGMGGKFHKWTNLHHVIWVCPACKEDTYQLVQGLRENTGPDAFRPRPSEDRVEFKVIHQFPVFTPVLDKAVPEAVRTAMVDAEKCMAIGAHNACGTMARRAMDAICLDKGGVGKGPYARLEDLKSKQVITPELCAWASELREAGKVGAHPEWEAMNETEAKYAVELLRDLIRHVYIVPAEVAARRFASKPKLSRPPAAETPEKFP